MKTIQIRTEIPGPNSRALMARREAAIPRGPPRTLLPSSPRAPKAPLSMTSTAIATSISPAELAASTSATASARVISAMQAQLEKHLHLCFAVTPYEGYVAVAEKLNALAPGNFPKKTILVNSGAEAIENAVKIARAYTKRPAVICFEDASTVAPLLTMSLTSKTHPYKAGFPAFCQRHLPHSLRLSLPRAKKAPRRKPSRITSKTRSSVPLLLNRSPPSSPSPFSAKAASSSHRAITLGSCQNICRKPRHPIHRRRNTIRFRPAPANGLPRSISASSPI